VETQEKFFCEGAWNGEFADGRLDQATVFMGSGGVINHDAITFVSPTHFLEKLYLVREKENVLVANSLAFVLAEAKDACASTYLDYLYDLIDFNKRGLHRRHTNFPTARGNRVHLYQRCNVVVTNALNVKIRSKPPITPPKNFLQYRQLLQAGVRGINANALSGLRKRTYVSIATVSSGYDSTACAVFAKEVGCKEAVTFSSAKPTKELGDDLDDSGKGIAEVLNLSVTEYDRNAYQQNSHFPEAEFCACGTGEDINLAAMESAFAGRLVFTGTRGDFVWDRLGFPVTKWNIVSFGVTEFRLRVGYIHMAPCSIGEEFSRTVKKLSNSPEMKLWSIGEFYDRPIPRRVAEEAGIPRSYFGQQKKASSIPPIWGTDGMTEKSARDFREFAKSRYQTRSTAHYIMFMVSKFFFHLNNRANKILVALAKGLGKELVLHPMLSKRYLRFPSMDDLTFHWGQQRIASRYTNNHE